MKWIFSAFQDILFAVALTKADDTRAIQVKLSDSPKILIVPDSFKGTLDAPLVAAAVKKGFLRIFPKALIDCFPMADGGEGSSSIVGAILGATRVEVPAVGPEGRLVEGFYYQSRDGARAFIELAAASGLPLSKNPKQTAPQATTFGTGQLVRHAITHGARQVTLFLGGSATSDAGVGMAKAIGFKFLDAAGAEMPDALTYLERGHDFPGERLSEIAEIRSGTAASLLEGVQVVAVVDVPNSLFGAHGAAYIYGPQKGLDPDGVRIVDVGLEHVAFIVKRDLRNDYAQLPGAGAAGGAGYGVLAFFGGELQPGAPYFLDLIDFNIKASGADLVITGEGKVDVQSVEGKLLRELLVRTAERGKPLLSLAGTVDLAAEHFERNPHFSAFGLGRPDALTKTACALELLAQQVAKLLV